MKFRPVALVSMQHANADSEGRMGFGHSQDTMWRDKSQRAERNTYR